MSDESNRNEDSGHSNSNNHSSVARQLLLWGCVFVIVPMMLWYASSRSDRKIKVLSSSEFENLLTANRIATVLVEEETSSAVQNLSGEYWPAGTKIGDQKALHLYRSKVLYTDAVDALIRANCPKREVKSGGSLLMSILMSPLLFLVMIVLFYWLFFRQMRAANGGALQFGKSRARMLNPSDEKITFKDVAGINEAREEMEEIVDYLKAPEKFSRLGGRIPHGVLMVGPPGTGKTLLAKAIAGEAGVPFFTISGSDFVELFVGVGASRVRDMFAEAKKHSPCLIFIDEIDAVGRSRFSGIGGGHDEREQTLNAMLVEMDGFEANAGVIVLAATNRPDVLDPALLRPGRFDRQVVIDLPDMEGRAEILAIHAKKLRLDPNVDLHVIARGTPGFSGADLANLLNEAAIMATRANKDMVTLAELEEARDKVRWGKERRSRKMTERVRKLTAYHESGHTLVNLHLKHTEPLHKVTIIPRGMALGATMYLPVTDRYDITENEALDMMVMCMGGRCAEKLIFDEITSGAAMDIRQATQTARKMICEWGMSPELGPISYSGREEHIFLGRDLTRSADMSPDTEREIDLAIRKLVDAAEERAMKILTEHRDQLELLAQTLILKETMSAEQVYELLGMEPPKNSESEEKEKESPSSDEPTQ